MMFNTPEIIANCACELAGHCWSEGELTDNLRTHFGNLAPRLTAEELEAKIHAVVVNKRENENWGNAIRREFSTVACGDGVDWKAKYQSAKEELEESEHARHLQIEELASVHSEIEAAERERDALAARVRELEDELKTFVAVRVDRIEKEKMRDMHRRMLSETVAAFTEAIDSLHRFYGKRLAELEARHASDV